MNSNLLETPRLKIHIASDEEIRSLIAAQRDDALKAAYTEMFKGSAEHPDARKWYAPWIIELKDGTHVGELCFMGPPSGGAVEIGYGISEEYPAYGPKLFRKDLYKYGYCDAEPVLPPFDTSED